MRHASARVSSVLLALAAAACLCAAEPTAGTATGSLAGYASEERELTVSSAGGSTRFRVAPDARLWQGSHRLPLAQLSSHVGWQVTVSWSEVAGVKTTHTVRLATTPPRHQ
jgi:hypothetical protein